MRTKLREVRKSKGISQTHLAQKLGFKSVSGYNLIELGKRRLDVDRAQEIAKILGVEVNEILCAEDLHSLGSGLSEHAATAESA